ncbi:unnamed protein product, partial [Meganyctiphanes norvegica]
KDLKASTFLRALKELSCRHSTPQILLSDNATNFASTNKLLIEISKNLSVLTQKAGLNISWRFIPVKAPWTGGVYERLIGNLKRNLTKMNLCQSIFLDEFREHVFECERVINDRPLQQVGETEVITPSMLLYGRKLGGGGTLSSLYIDTLLEDSKYLRKVLPQLYKDNVQRRKRFWEAFQADYLDSLRLSSESPKKGNSKLTRVPKEGDLIMLHDADPRIKPRKALVLRTIRSDDGGIRSCKVRIGNHESIRPVSSFRDLELNVYDTYQHQESKVKDHKVNAQTVEHLLTSNRDCGGNSVLPTVDQEEPLLSPLPQRIERGSKVKARQLIGQYYS